MPASFCSSKHRILLGIVPGRSVSPVPSFFLKHRILLEIVPGRSVSPVDMVFQERPEGSAIRTLFPCGILQKPTGATPHCTSATSCQSLLVQFWFPFICARRGSIIRAPPFQLVCKCLLVQILFRFTCARRGRTIRSEGPFSCWRVGGRRGGIRMLRNWHCQSGSQAFGEVAKTSIDAFN